MGSAASYLSKYWTLNASNITTPDYDISAVYANVDINGTEADMLAHKYDATSGWTAYSAVNTATNSFAETNIPSFGDFSASDAVAIVSSQDGNWNIGATWLGGIVPNESNNAVVQNTHTVTLTSNDTVNSLAINSGGELLTSGNKLSLMGNLSVSGDYDNNGTIEFIGSSGSQTIDGIMKFDDLIINNTNGVNIVSGSDSITGTLTLTLGNFATNNSFTLISNSSVTARIHEITGGTISGNITMQRYIDAGATDWRFLTSAVSGTTIAEFNDDFITSGFIGSDFPDWPAGSPWPNIYFYDESVLGSGDLGFVVKY